MSYVNGYGIFLQDGIQKKALIHIPFHLTLLLLKPNPEVAMFSQSETRSALNDFFQKIRLKDQNQQSGKDKTAKIGQILSYLEIIHAQVGDMVGEKAFYDLMRWRDGEFVTRQSTEAAERTVHGTTMGLLMEGARQVDEGIS